jgi:hypothetical protein
MRVEREKKIRSDEKFHELFISKRFWLETRDVRCYVPKSPSLLSGLPGEQSRYPLLRLHMRMCMMELVSDNCLVTPINKYYLCICLQRIFPNYLQKKFFALVTPWFHCRCSHSQTQIGRALFSNVFEDLLAMICGGFADSPKLLVIRVYGFSWGEDQETRLPSRLHDRDFGHILIHFFYTDVLYSSLGPHMAIWLQINVSIIRLNGVPHSSGKPCEPMIKLFHGSLPPKRQPYKVTWKGQRKEE